MKKVVLLSLLLILLVGCDKKIESFYLEEQYYHNGSIMELNPDQFEDLVEKKESFAVFIYQPLCATSSSFEKVLNEFLQEYQIGFYKMSFSDMKETSLAKNIKYYPSFAIFYEGELVDFLDANSDDDTIYYESLDGFAQWFSKFVFVNKNES